MPDIFTAFWMKITDSLERFIYFGFYKFEFSFGVFVRFSRLSQNLLLLVCFLIKFLCPYFLEKKGEFKKGFKEYYRI